MRPIATNMSGHLLLKKHRKHTNLASEKATQHAPERAIACAPERASEDQHDHEHDPSNKAHGNESHSVDQDDALSVYAGDNDFEETLDLQDSNDDDTDLLDIINEDLSPIDESGPVIPDRLAKLLRKNLR